MEISPGTGWQKILDNILEQEGTIMVVGASDAGKSTFIGYLLRGILAKGKKACLVDSDVGQSSLGLPGTISKRVFRGIKDLRYFAPDEMIFTGVTNPAKNFTGMIEGTRVLVNECEKKGVNTILIDTTGLIYGHIGAALKSAKIRALKPRLIIGIEQENEVRHMLSHIKPADLNGVEIKILKSSPYVKKRNPKSRSEYRAVKLRSYFKNTGIQEFHLDGLKLFYKRKALEGSGHEPETGTLVGLNRDGKTLALGIYEGVRQGEILIKTPLKLTKKVNEIVFGDITLDTGSELTQSSKPLIMHI